MKNPSFVSRYSPCYLGPMLRSTFACLPLAISVILASVAGPALADPADHATPAEKAYIEHVAKVLLARYPSPAAAEKAGYRKTTGFDSSGTAIYFDFTFSRISRLHPNFLWYDRQGHLVGLDYEFPQTHGSRPPAGYPVGRQRWTTIHPHVHVAYRQGHGPIQLGAGPARANLRTPPITASALRADGLLPEGASLVWAYYHPRCWDLGFWLIPDSKGAFADLNPAVR